ncbi:MAG: hypothetical protein AMJ56_03675 [Anaerolineae bacterium SG8_19]|jgi:hypothetical protein|nr:MAG: hypothetical protein AMJ56_03675 [Anaerolineae bacterium SG8_19]
MTYEKAVNALVNAGFLAKADAPAAVKALDSSSIDMTYSAWAEALVKAGLLDEANKEAAATAMEDAQWAEAVDDPEGFDENLAGAGIL